MKLRMRVKGSSRATKPMGGSSSSNPKSLKHREAARAQRLAHNSPMIAVDELMEKQQRQPPLDAALLNQLPLKNMSLYEKRHHQQNQQLNVPQQNEKPQLKNSQHQQKETNEEASLLKKIKEEDTMENKKLLLKEHRIWQILPSHLSTTPPDYQSTMPILAPILGSALNERPDLRLTALASIRAALQMDHDHSFNVMQKFAKNFLPIIFSIYSNDNQESMEAEGEAKAITKKVDFKAVHQSCLETIRLYMRHIPPPLLKQYISVALQKLAGPDAPKGKIPEKNLFLADILIAMCISAEVDALQAIFTCLEPWFTAEDGRMQKKAYRLLAQIYQRIKEPELALFFAENRPFLKQIISTGNGKVAKSSHQWRIAIYRNVVDSFDDFDALSEFCKEIFDEIVEAMEPANSTPTRHQAANCLLEMSREQLRLWSQQGMTAQNPLNWMFAKLFDCVKSYAAAAQSAEEENCKNQQPQDSKNHFQCPLIALNILAQKQLKNANATLISQLVGHSSTALQAAEPKARPLAIRLVRTICLKMQPFMFDQYKDLIVNAVFSQPLKGPTVRIRKSNALLLNLLLDRLGIEELIKFAEGGNNVAIWTKMMRNIEKMRRRRERKKQIAVGDGTFLPSTDVGRRSRSGAESSVVSASGSTAISTLISTLGAKTAYADSIFDILGDDSDEEGQQGKGGKSRAQRRRKSGHSSALSVVIEEGDNEDDDPLDLLDKKALAKKVTLVKRKDFERSRDKKRKLNGGKNDEEEKGPFQHNKEGKLLIENLDDFPGKRKKRRKRDLDEEEDTQKEDEAANEGGADGDSNDEEEEDEDE